ncbi:hypothetical protein [Streptomyces levis]|uniref:hypothetical protein n=1 Tax=Streptomyces levis TaxID=285566 RepID=UPI003CD08AF6
MFLPRAWGRGYAAEACAVALEGAAQQCRASRSCCAPRRPTFPRCASGPDK